MIRLFRSLLQRVRLHLAAQYRCGRLFPTTCRLPQKQPRVLSVPLGGGLVIDGGVSGLDSKIVIDNNVTPGGNHLVNYSDKGLVIGGRAIEAADLPIATSGTVGAISAGPEFTVKPSGEMNLANVVTGATYPVITFNNNGLVTSGRDLAPSDIPPLSADKITSGTLDADVIGDKSITKEMLADYTIAYIQEDQPTVTSEDHVGILWYQESTAQLRMWNSNSWMPVGFGRLSMKTFVGVDLLMPILALLLASPK